VNEKVTRIGAAQTGECERTLPAIIVGDEGGLRRLAELLAPYLPTPVAPAEPNGWLCTREAAEYAGTTRHALHKAMAAREIHFEQDVPGGKAWFKRTDIDAWRRGERPASQVRRAA
jgi:excisionase family DNA binding protein